MCNCRVLVRCQLGLKTDIRTIIDGVEGKTGLVVAELPDGPEIQINGDQPFRAASVIKVPILYELYRKHEKTGLDLDAIHLVSDSNICVEPKGPSHFDDNCKRQQRNQ